MKVGDYIRTNDGYIFRAKQLEDVEGEEINEDEFQAILYYYDEVHLIDIDKIKKISPNIIDLIEEGDILKVNDFKDVYTIYEVEMFRNPYINEKYLGIRNDIGRKPKRLGEIPLVNLSIVTKEQFESMEYKVGE